MSEIKQLTEMFSLPGIQRDGTRLDSNFYIDGQWVRFQRGRPKKIGGHRLVSSFACGPVRAQLVWSHNNVNYLYSFGSTGISVTTLDNDGSGSNTYFLTPVGFVENTDYNWSVDMMYDAAGGNSIILAVATPSMPDIASDDTGQIYYAVAGDVSSAFVALGSVASSGGLCVVEPYLFYFGTEGYIGWSDANQPATITSGDAGSARVSATKVVSGLPMRSGTGPGAIFWTLNAVVRADWIGGAAVFRFSTLNQQTSILSQNCTIEYDGTYYWIGIDRFLKSNGSTIEENTNNNNLDYFFDNLNFAERQKVWAMKIPRFGEIWWFYPSGENTECDKAIIFNVREKSWYDISLARSAGYYSRVFRYPVMANAEESATSRWLQISGLVGTFVVGDRLHGGSSGVQGYVTKVLSATDLLVMLDVDDTDFTVLETIHDTTSGASATYDGKTTLCSTYVHERGYNAISGDIENPIYSFFETSDFGYANGGSGKTDQPILNRLTRLTRVEPDFMQTGEMSIIISGRMWPEGTNSDSEPYTFDSDTGRVDMREQRREISLKVISNVLNGSYTLGKTLLHIEPGDVRS